MTSFLKIQTRQLSLYPITTPIKNKQLNKIYARHFLYIIGLIELHNNTNKKFNSKLQTSYFIQKKISNSTQILRSPNRHKIAQFHIAKKQFIITHNLILKFNDQRKFNNLIPLLNLVSTNFINFESTLLYIKNLKLTFKSIYQIKFINLTHIIKRYKFISIKNFVVLLNKKYFVYFIYRFFLIILINYFFQFLLNNNLYLF